MALPLGPNSWPTYFYLDTTVTSHVVEPEGRLYDDLHRSESDRNYWNFCTAGAVTVAVNYWLPDTINTWGGSPQPFTEPYGPHRETYYWGPTDTGVPGETGNGYATVGRSYIMMIAEQSDPPDFAYPGLLPFFTYPTTGVLPANVTDIRDVLNWEISSHNLNNWSAYFYALAGANTLTQANLLADVETDVAADGVAVVVTLNTYVSSSVHLPNWTTSVPHAITVVGYNNSTGTFRYTDTCGVHCLSNSNGGIHDVSQSVLYQLIKSDGVGIIW